MFDYPVVLEEQPEGGFVVTFPDVPEAITQGEDEDEALLYAVDALETALSFYVDARKPLPKASKAKRGQRVVSPSALECAKLGIYQAMTEQGIKKAELARRLTWHMPQGDRLFDFKHSSRMDQIEDAARALGCFLVVNISSKAPNAQLLSPRSAASKGQRIPKNRSAKLVTPSTSD